MSRPTSRIPRGSLVLITGANGYISTHIIDVLLESGYNVRGTVRAHKPWLDEHFTKKYGNGRYESVIVPDLQKDAALDDVAKGVAGFIHVASDMSLGTDAEVVVANVIAQTRNALKAAAKSSSVKSFVLMSSSSAALLPEANKTGVVVGQDTWNDFAVNKAFSGTVTGEQQIYLVYAASKTEGERTAWNFMKESQPNFAFNTVLPNMNTGEILMPEIGGSTMGWIRDIVKGTVTLPVMDVFAPQWFIDVRDTARLTVAGLLDPSVQGERLYGFAEPFNWTEILDILRKLRPDNKEIPASPLHEGHDLSEVSGSKRSEDLIKSFFGVVGWTSLEQSLEAGIKDL